MYVTTSFINMPVNKRNTCCSSICGMSILIFTTIFFILYAVAYTFQNEYEATTCNITDVTYPTSFPTDDTLNLWSGCDCGKQCQTKYPCINLYVDGIDARIKFNYERRDYACTITENECPRGEDLLIANQELHKTITIAQTYINATVGCYKHATDPIGNPIFLYIDHKDAEKSFIIGASLFGVNVIFLIGIYIHYKLSECNRKEKENEKEMFVGNPAFGV
jgi:hypothetical protein